MSQDPNSLANLDQDLPNNMIHQVPIFSLPQVSAHWNITVVGHRFGHHFKDSAIFTPGPVPTDIYETKIVFLMATKEPGTRFLLT